MSVTGPFESVDFSHSRGVHSNKTVWRQTPPYRKPLPYVRFEYRGTYYDSKDGLGTRPAIDLGQVGYRDSTQNTEWVGQARAYAQAYDSFVNRMKSSADLGVGLAEISSSYSMIRNRTVQMLQVVSAAKRRDFDLFLKALHLTKDVRQRRRLKTVWDRATFNRVTPANLLLEVNFGWRPVIADIGAAVEVLQSEFPIVPIVGRGKSSDRVEWASQTTWSFDRYRLDYDTRVQIRGFVVPTNPNLALANQLGFVNPAAIAWQVIPVSFLFDWFLPVGKFLESFTDFVGFSLVDGSMSRRISLTEIRSSDYGGNGGRGLEIWTSKGEQFRRNPVSSLPHPALLSRLRLPGGPLLGKATSTVAMLIQQLSNKR